MYLIINSKTLIAEVSQHACYVRRQKNGVVILSDKENADAIYSNDTNTFYPIEKVEYLCESYKLVEVDNVPENVVGGYYYYHAGEFYTTESDLTALAKSQAPELASIVFVSMAEKGELNDATITEHFMQFPKWGYTIDYAINTICQYNDKLYRCLQAHTSQKNWEPANVPSLWKEIGNPNTEYPEWSQPIGALDAYQVGDKVSYNGNYWISICENNVWAPDVYGWKQV